MKFDLIYYQCTTKCNLKCPYCYSGKSKSDELSPKEIRKYFNFKTNTLCVTGGEMCLRGDIAKTINALLETVEVKKIILCSNFLFPDKLKEIIEHNLPLLKKSDVEISGSLDGLEETHEQIRGKGTFRKVINTIRILKDYRKISPNLSVAVNMCIFPANYMEIISVFCMVNELNIKFNYCFPHPLDRKDMIWNDTIYDSIEFQLKQIKLFDPIRFRIFKDKKRTKSCMAGKKWCVIYPNGNISPCWNPYSGLNLKVNKISEIIKDLQNFKPSKNCLGCDRYDVKF